MDETLYQYLVSRPEISSLVDDRVHPDFIPQEDRQEQELFLPAIVYRLESAQNSGDLDGNDGMVMATYSLIAVGRTRAESHRLRDAVRVAMGGFVDDIGTHSNSRVWIEGPLSDGDDIEVSPDQDERRRFINTQTFQITYYVDASANNVLL